jgi:D-alanyl-D-alanine carboxypeptidase/D-alanyl-D-alanine-endopeptidase (penicillin-binding protein 4)
LRTRLSDAAYRGRLRAKTGWIERVSSLSGYCQTRSGEVLAFAMLFNGYTGRNQQVKAIQDAIVELLIDLSPEPEQDQ